MLVLECNGSEAHATRGRDGRQKGRECGYYHLHRYLNDSLLHASPPFRLVLVEAIIAIIAVVTATGIVTASGIGTAALLTALAAILTLRASILCVLCSLCALCVFVVLHLAAVAGGYALQHFTVLVETGNLDRGVLQLVLQVNVGREDDTSKRMVPKPGRGIE